MGPHLLLEEEERDKRHEQNRRVLEQQGDADGQQLDGSGVGGLQHRDSGHPEHGHDEDLPWRQSEGTSVDDEQHKPGDQAGAERAELGQLESRQPALDHDLRDAAVRAEQQRPDEREEVAHA